jgi:hypothetical protein
MRRAPAPSWLPLLALLLLLGCPLGLLASACGTGVRMAAGSTGTGGSSGTGGSTAGACPAQACPPASGPGSSVWNQVYGSAGEQLAGSLAVDGAGNVVFAGTLISPDAVDFGCGPLSAPMNVPGLVVAKLDRCHKCVWSRVFDGATVAGVAVAPSGDIVVTGSFGGSLDVGGTVLTTATPAAFVVGLDGSGATRWSHGFGAVDGGAAECSAAGVAIDGAGNVLLAGNFGGTIDFAGEALTVATGTGSYLGKLDSDGTRVWSRSFGSNLSVAAIATDAARDLLVTGTFQSTLDFGCGPIPGNADGSYQLVALTLDAVGVCKWIWRPVTATHVAAIAIAADAASNVVVVGSLGGATIDLGGGPIPSPANGEVFVLGLGSDGSYRWGKSFGNLLGAGLAVNGAGDVFLESMLSGPTDLGGGPLGASNDLCVASLDATGAFRWGHAFPVSAPTPVGAIAVDTSSRLLVAGEVAGTCDFGCGPLTGATAADVFLAELTQ